MIAGTGAAAIITTLPPPHDAFVLAPGEHADIWVTEDTIVRSTSPISIAQLFVGSSYTTSGKGGPSLVLIPPVESYEEEAWVYVPASWPETWVTFVSQSSSAPFGQCETSERTDFDENVSYKHQCKVDTAGWLRVKGDPFTGLIYGYSDGSAFAMQAAGFNVTWAL